MSYLILLHQWCIKKIFIITPSIAVSEETLGMLFVQVLLYTALLYPSLTLGLLEEALGSFYAPSRPLSDVTVLEFREPISKLSRRFFHNLLRC